MTGFAMRSILDVSNVEVAFVDEDDLWRFHWGGAGQVAAFFLPSDRHEFAGQWYLSIEAGHGDEQVTELLMIVLSAVAALLTGGTLDDDNYPFERPDLTADALLSQALREAPLEPEAAVHLLVTGHL
ncbi:hypothetical protein [Nonomuraea gerenzanensis]|uniref:Uncharacterized protein n=1 Tax=Nonomuraea gerenzanensis TaxID=93944 RepID=A0A1M4DZ67_9ACTN|nr:hypothetical protein [Nonomuraea gerenzanensis]UBU14154.1 hypothetical protein LCN96_03720 [Nonomuraea gerenzanensis]SBO91844.1 hypothetical protein BN4615_P1358 [Nonomuraea gerenzanensis]